MTHKKTARLILLGAMVLLASSPVMANTLFTQANALLIAIRDFLVGAGSVAAVIGLGTGAFMRWFSGGDERKVDKGNRVMAGSVVSWCVLVGAQLIFNTLQPYLQ